MRCEEVRELLPDHALGTVSELEAAAIRQHLRGCGACRTDLASLDSGVALFASVAHDMEPPADLKARVLGVLAEEWRETPARERARPRRFASMIALAAAVVALAGALTWGAVGHATASQNSQDALSYRAFLHTLGGKDVRVGALTSASRSIPLEGSAIVYDSDRGQSWVLVMVRAPGYTGELSVSLNAPGGRVITLPRPLGIDGDGEGSAWLVTGADVSDYTTVRLIDGNAALVASARVLDP